MHIPEFDVGRFLTGAVRSALNELELVSSGSPLRLGRCELWCGPNKWTLKTWDMQTNYPANQRGEVNQNALPAARNGQLLVRKQLEQLEFEHQSKNRNPKIA